MSSSIISSLCPSLRRGLFAITWVRVRARVKARVGQGYGYG